jgi:predicted DNA-binding protein
VSLQRTNVYLEDDQLDALKVLAAARGDSLATVVREAVDAYLRDHFVSDDAWRMRFEDLRHRVQARTASSVTPEEIEADITEARNEVRRLHRASRRR